MLIKDAIGIHALSAILHVLDDGEQALRFINDVDEGKERCPQLMILDLNLPRKTGKEVLVHLRRSRTCAQVPVLVVTSSSVDKEEIERLGGDGYFQKPTDYDEYMKVGEFIRGMLESPGRS
jgi:chemotaxis family two-component system response regulator Rcp1